MNAKLRLVPIALGILTAGYVPASHTLKRLPQATPRFSQQAVVEQVVNRARPGELIFATTDQYLMPFAERIWTGVRDGKPPSVVWVFPSEGAFNEDYGTLAAQRFGCALAARNGLNVIWGIHGPRVTAFDRSSGRAQIVVPDGLAGDVRADFVVEEVMYEVVDGFYFRGRVTGATLEPAGDILFQADQPAACGG